MFFAHQMTFQSPTNGDTAPFLSHWNKLIGTAIRHTITVLELPPSESCSSRVSLEFLYGMCWDFPSTNADMTFPRVDNDRLIFVASFNRWPVAPVLDCLSEPYIHTSTATPPRLIRSGEKQHTFAVNAWCQFLIKFSRYHTHTHNHLTALCPGLPRWAGTRKVKPMWVLLKQETVSGSGISWAICKSAPRSRQITTPAPHHSDFYRLDALPDAQPTASKHWRHWIFQLSTIRY